MPILSKESAPGLVIATGKLALPVLTDRLSYCLTCSQVHSDRCHLGQYWLFMVLRHLSCEMTQNFWLSKVIIWRILDIKNNYSSCILGSVGKNLASKTNVYISSSAGARWREVSPLPPQPLPLFVGECGLCLDISGTHTAGGGGQ